VESFLASEEGQVFFMDEGRFGLQPVVGRGWALKGKRAQTVVRPGYQNFYVYASVSPLSGDSFALFLPWVNTEMMNVYLEQLSLAYPSQAVWVILDQAGWHQSKGLKVPAKIRLLPLPAYSPELNPVEKLWQWLRRTVCRNRSFESEGELMDRLSESLRVLSPTRLKSLCRCSYLLHIN
jgi:putative transposase